MTPYKRGDVVLVPFPFSNQAAAKKRPAVVISSSLTSKVDKYAGIGECLVQDWQTAGLLKPSAIKSALSTIEQTLVLKRLGKLSQRDMTSLEQALKDLFDLK
jgi:mRNA interferase MazF